MYALVAIIAWRGYMKRERISKAMIVLIEVTKFLTAAYIGYLVAKKRWGNVIVVAICYLLFLYGIADAKTSVVQAECRQYRYITISRNTLMSVAEQREYAKYAAKIVIRHNTTYKLSNVDVCAEDSLTCFTFTLVTWQYVWREMDKMGIKSQ
jgi:hypothetical protein